MATDVHAAVGDSRFCAQNRTDGKRRRQLKLFFPEGLPEYIATDILGPLQETREGNQFIVVVTEPFTKVTTAIPRTETNATKVALIFVYHMISNYGSRSRLLTEKRLSHRAKILRGNV